MNPCKTAELYKKGVAFKKLSCFLHGYTITTQFCGKIPTLVLNKMMVFPQSYVLVPPFIKSCLTNFYRLDPYFIFNLIILSSLIYTVVSCRFIFLSHVDYKDIQIATDRLCQRYIQNRYIPPEDDWPPYHPKHYTPLTIIHHEGRHTETEVITVAQEMVGGGGIV